MTDPGRKRPAAARKAFPRQSRDRREISRALPERGGCAWGGSSRASRRAAPGRPRALSGQLGTGRTVLAWRRVAAAVGGVGGRAKAALTGAWEPPTRRRLRGRCPLRSPCASPAAPRGAGVLEAAQGVGGREWPRPLLLCIIVTQAISCLEVWEKGKKKNPGWGQGYRGCGEPESGGLEGTRVGSGRHLLPSSPRGCLAREPAEKCSLLQRYFGVLGRTEGGSHTPPSVGVEAAAAGTGWSLQPARPLPCLFPSLQNCC